MKRFVRRALIAGAATALAAAAYGVPASVQAAAPADTPVPLCLSVTVVDLVNTADQLCGGKDAT